MGYSVVVGQNGRIKSAHLNSTTVARVSAPKPEPTQSPRVSGIIVASAQVESMSPERIPDSRRYHRYDSVRGKGHRERDKLRLGRYV